MTKFGITGIGGVFFKARDPKTLAEWYAQHLGLEGASFQVFPGAVSTVWAVFPEASDYFGAGQKPFMINFRVRDLVGLLAELEQAGVAVDGKMTVDENGKFGWVIDPEGNRVELWEAAEGK